MVLKINSPSQYENYLLEVNDRIELDEFDQTQLFTLEIGYTGELIFYEFIKNCGGAKLWNLRLDFNGES